MINLLTSTTASKSVMVCWMLCFFCLLRSIRSVEKYYPYTKQEAYPGQHRNLSATWLHYICYTPSMSKLPFEMYSNYSQRGSPAFPFHKDSISHSSSCTDACALANRIKAFQSLPTVLTHQRAAEIGLYGNQRG